MMAFRSLFNPTSCISDSISTSSSHKSHQPTQPSQTLLCISPPDKNPIKRRNVLLIATWSSALTFLLMPNSSSSAAISSNIDNQFPRALEVIRTLVRRPKKSRSMAKKEVEEEVLEVEQIQLPWEVAMKFDVYMKNPLPPKDFAKFVSRFLNVPQARFRAASRSRLSTCMRLRISCRIEGLGADADDDVEVNLVPRHGTDAGTTKGLR